MQPRHVDFGSGGVLQNVFYGDELALQIEIAFIGGLEFLIGFHESSSSSSIRSFRSRMCLSGVYLSEIGLVRCLDAYPFVERSWVDRWEDLGGRSCLCEAVDEYLVVMATSSASILTGFQGIARSGR